jgi:predicted nucleic acid-binding protein
MRTNIVVNDDLLAEALRIHGGGSKRAVVEAALQTYVEVKTAERRRQSYRPQRAASSGPRSPMKTLVLDTSVAAAWYLPETFAPEARRWRDRLLAGDVQLLVPSLHYWELANVLRTYVRRAEIEASLAREVYDLHLDAPLELAEPDRARVLEVALEYEATAYDAVYIALALLHDAPLLTAERTTTPWVVRMGDHVQRVGRS